MSFLQKFAKQEKTGQIMSEVNELGRAIDNVDTAMDNLDNAIQELPSDDEEKKEGVREITKLYDEVGRACVKVTDTFEKLERRVKEGL